MKVDARGAVEWSRAIGGDEDDKVLGVAETGDGNYAVLVDSDSFVSTYAPAGPWIVWLDRQGGLLRQVSYDRGHPHAITGPLPAAGVVVLGKVDQDVWLIELDGGGDEIRQRKLAGAPEEYQVGFHLLRTSDGGYLLVSVADSFGAGNSDFWLVKLDASLRIEWQRTYGSPDDDEARPSAWQTSDGGYLLGGVFRPDPDEFDSAVLRLDPEGNLLWSRRFDGVGDLNFFAGIVETADGGVLVAHDVDPPADIENTRDIRLLRLSSAGDPLWMREYGFDYPDRSAEVFPIFPLSDGGIFVAGASETSEGNVNAWLLNLDADGLIGGDGCGLTRDVLVSEIPYAPQVTETDAYFEETAIGRFETDAVPWEPPLEVVEQCSAPSCVAARCGWITSSPATACEGETVTLALSSACGEGPVSVGWDLDGDTVEDARGMQVQAELAAGDHEITATATDSCPDPGPGSCQARATVTVLPSTPPGEVSGPGEPRLRVVRGDDGEGIQVESDAEAAAYNLYVDRIGSWYAPSAATGSACHRTDGLDIGGGAVEIEQPLPVDSWIVVTASTPCAEGPAGPDSEGTERTSLPTWDLCGPAR